MVTLDAMGDLRIVGYPVCIENKAYERNMLLFNFALVFASGEPTQAYNPVVCKVPPPFPFSYNYLLVGFRLGSTWFGLGSVSDDLEVRLQGSIPSSPCPPFWYMYISTMVAGRWSLGERERRQWESRGLSAKTEGSRLWCPLQIARYLDAMEMECQFISSQLTILEKVLGPIAEEIVTTLVDSGECVIPLRGGINMYLKLMPPRAKKQKVGAHTREKGIIGR